jgi:outer membrane receptor protein involved in Fe transport
LTGVSSNNEGYYSISVPYDGRLIFSSIGYKTTEITVASSGEINVELHPDSEFIDETIVVAYGTATRSSFTGSASMIGTEAIESRVTTSVTNALAGAAPGVQVISSSGDPASGEATIRIRGIGSMSASNSPLFIVDGMPYDGAISELTFFKGRKNGLRQIGIRHATLGKIPLAVLVKPRYTISVKAPFINCADSKIGNKIT